MAMSPNRPWLSGAEVARILGCAPRSVPRLMRQAPVRRQKLPQLPTRYFREDVLKYANSVIEQPALAG